MIGCGSQRLLSAVVRRRDGAGAAGARV